MTRTLNLILILLTFFSCSNPKEETQKLAPKRTPSDSIIYNIFRTDSMNTARIDNQLKNLNEPDLKNYKNDAYRFILFQAFKDYCLLFRIERDKMDNVTLTTKHFWLKSPTGEGKDTVIKETKIILTSKDWDKIQDKINESYFWTLELNDNPPRHIDDGSYWIIEGKRVRYLHLPTEPFKDYTRVQRNSPYEGSSFYELGEFIATRNTEFKAKNLY